ncbi:MAG: hypothetical protein CVU57_28780 [Deltaproteobacteria bacterium HGW-Deltaproteobacteria-15]|jgi:hypothetical protein|nr:MAG: hypothetical protein CVU57_28780 [Deltaproteobacteria bacterium HGW-Deltaproteobacteria-15]
MENPVQPPRTHVYLRLKTETVRSLKRLQNQSAQASIDDLIVKMIGLTDAHRSSLKNFGWRVYKGYRN